VDVETRPQSYNTLRLSTEYCVKRSHPQRVYVVAIRKIASAEDDRLETDVRCASSGMDAIDRQEVLRGPSVGIVPILVRYREILHDSRSITAVMAFSLAGVRTVRGRPAFTNVVGVTFPVSRRRCSNRRNTLACG
jgi:hypothetical protein